MKDGALYTGMTKVDTCSRTITLTWNTKCDQHLDDNLMFHTRSKDSVPQVRDVQCHAPVDWQAQINASILSGTPYPVTRTHAEVTATPPEPRHVPRVASHTTNSNKRGLLELPATTGLVNALP
jgi:hypothetical protein